MDDVTDARTYRPARSMSKVSAGIRHHLPAGTWVAGCTVLLWIALSVASPYFLTSGNVFNIARQVSVDAIIAYGELFTIITAGIDLSIGLGRGPDRRGIRDDAGGCDERVAGCCPGACAGPRHRDGERPRHQPAGHSGVHRHLSWPSGVPQMTMLISGGAAVSGIPPSLRQVSNTAILGIPETMFVIMLSFAVVSMHLLGMTRLGRYMYALGSNIEAARRVGINVTRVTLVAYGLSAVFAAVAGMLLVARLTMGNPNAGFGSELQAIAAAVVGGASLFGGRGTIAGYFFGAIPVHHDPGNGANLLRGEFVLAVGDRGTADRRRGLSGQFAEAPDQRAVGVAERRSFACAAIGTVHGCLDGMRRSIRHATKPCPW